MFCLEPLIAVGFAASIQTSWHKSEPLDGYYLQVQTCTTGLGAYVKWSDEWVASGVQYGLTFELADHLNLTIQAQGGGSYSNTHHPITGIRQITKFHGGAVVMLSYDRYMVLAEYNHMSNGKGIDPTNEGQDLAAFQVGCSFK